MKIEYRTPAGSGTYTTLADEAAGSLGDQITGYVARPEQAALFRGGLWTVSFATDLVHASPDAALYYVMNQGGVFALPTVWRRVGLFDLKVTVGAQVLYLLKCAVTGFNPAVHSDRSTLIQYQFNWGQYTD